MCDVRSRSPRNDEDHISPRVLVLRREDDPSSPGSSPPGSSPPRAPVSSSPRRAVSRPRGVAAPRAVSRGLSPHGVSLRSHRGSSPLLIVLKIDSVGRFNFEFPSVWRVFCDRKIVRVEFERVGGAHIGAIFRNLSFELRKSQNENQNIVSSVQFVLLVQFERQGQRSVKCSCEKQYGILLNKNPVEQS